MKKILIPVDSSEFSERAVEAGKKFAKAFDCEVLLLHVVGLRVTSLRFSTSVPAAEPFDSFDTHERGYAEDMLETYKNSFGDMKDKVETKVLFGIVADEIIRTINNSDVDFVIVGSHGIGSALFRAFLGSVANKVVHHSLKPVLVVK